MNVVVALAVGILFGAGVHLMVQRDMIKLAAGMQLISSAAALFLVAAGFGAGEAPILPIKNMKNLADPLAQALALTAIVISFGITVLLLRIILAIARTHDTIEMEDLVAAEMTEGEDSSNAPPQEQERQR
ncbi:MAG: sodium:proton antiporter [Nitrosospira sp.]|nr:sodium:proton antiporter [Nitrosospira sp.]